MPSNDTFREVKKRPHILVICPQAVGQAWQKVVENVQTFEPWPHQYSIAGWASQRHASLISADMGTGKTLTALMSSGCWGREMRCLDITRGTGKRRAEQLTAALASTPGTQTLVVCCNYEAFWRSELNLIIEKTPWSCIILDESHRIKAPGGKASRAAHRLARKQPQARRLCLTGTPMPQGPLDVYGQFRFLDQDVYGTSFARFRSRYAECDPRFPSKVRKYRNQPEFTQKFDTNSYRVMADDVLDLPDALHETIPVELSPATRRFYESLANDLTADIEAGTVTVGNALARLLRLQQATSGHTKPDEAGVVPIDGVPAKRRALEDRLSDLPVTEPVVVFCRFRADLEEVRAAAAELGRPYAEVSGVEKTLDRWQAGEATILGVQIQSGGVGIDCTRAAYAFYYSLGFSLGDYDQSLARLRRPGQKRCVRYYHLVAKGTVDEQVYAALRDRRTVIDAVMNNLTKKEEQYA